MGLSLRLLGGTIRGVCASALIVKLICNNVFHAYTFSGEVGDKFLVYATGGGCTV
jgi:hypothetical protein